MRVNEEKRRGGQGSRHGKGEKEKGSEGEREKEGEREGGGEGERDRERRETGRQGEEEERRRDGEARRKTSFSPPPSLPLLVFHPPSRLSTEFTRRGPSRPAPRSHDGTASNQPVTMMRGTQPHRPELRGASHAHVKKGGEGGVRDPRVFCPSKIPSFLARWRVRRRPAVRGPAGTGSVGDGVGEGATTPSSFSPCGAPLPLSLLLAHNLLVPRVH